MRTKYVFLSMLALVAAAAATAFSQPVVLNSPIILKSDGTFSPPNAPVTFSNGVFKLTRDVVIDLQLTPIFGFDQVYDYYWCGDIYDFHEYNFSITSGISIQGDNVVFDGQGYTVTVYAPAFSFFYVTGGRVYRFAHGVFGIYVNGTNVTIRNVKVDVKINRIQDASHSFTRTVRFDTDYGKPAVAGIFAYNLARDVSIRLENVTALTPFIDPSITEYILNTYGWLYVKHVPMGVFVPVNLYSWRVCFYNKVQGESNIVLSRLLPLSLPLAYAKPDTVGEIWIVNSTLSEVLLNASQITITNSRITHLSIIQNAVSTVNVTRSLLSGTISVYRPGREEPSTFSGRYLFRASKLVNASIYVWYAEYVEVQRCTLINVSMEVELSRRVLVYRNRFEGNVLFRLLPRYDWDSGAFTTEWINVSKNAFYLSAPPALPDSFVYDVFYMYGLRNVFRFVNNYWNITGAGFCEPFLGDSVTRSNTLFNYCYLDAGTHTVTFGSDLIGFDWTWSWTRGDPDGINDIPMVVELIYYEYDPTTGEIVPRSTYFMLDPYPLYAPPPEDVELEEEQPPPSQTTPPATPPPPSTPPSLPSLPSYMTVLLAVAVVVLFILVIRAALHVIIYAAAEARVFVKRRKKAD